VTPSEGFLTGSTDLNLTSVPILTQTQFDTLLTTPNLVLKNSPSIQLKRLSSDQSFTFDQSTKLNSSFVSASLTHNDYEVEFLLQDIPAGSSGVYYSIMKPFTLFGIFN
jgi:hypothetical protein